MGSRGVGGRRYQIGAVLLTYAAVSLAFIPIAIHYMRTYPSQPKQTQSDTASPKTQPLTSPTSGGGSRATTPTKPGLGEAIVKLTLLGLASPFFQLSSGTSGIIGLFILFIGMQFAWKITRGVQVAISGPYQAAAAAKG